MMNDEHHAHSHKTGLPWLDLVLAGSAIAVSVISLIVSVGHGRTMERLVEENALQVKASTLPILRFTTGNLDLPTSQPIVHLDVTNGGTGPAIIDWFQLSFAGKPVGNAKELLDACCRSNPSQTLGLTTNSLVTGQTLAPAQTLSPFTGRKAGGNQETYDRLESDGRFKIKAKACYCSVLDECWTTDFRQTRPTPVKVCGKPPGSLW